jgi:glycogen operon protein
MLCGGDEIGRTQKGNNNAYCQDNDVSWYDWHLDQRRKKLLEFICGLIEFRQKHPNLRRRKFFQDREVYHPSSRDIAWYRTDGQEMTEEQWNTGWMRSLAIMLNGSTLGQLDETGEPITDDTFLVMLNSYADCVTYTLPQSPRNRGWKLLMNTHDLDNPFGEKLLDGALDVAGRSVVVLRELTEGETRNTQTGQTDQKLEQTEPTSTPEVTGEPMEESAVLEEV